MLREPNATSEINYTKYTYNFPNDHRRVCEKLIQQFRVRHLSEVLDIIIEDYIDRNIKNPAQERIVAKTGEEIIVVRREIAPEKRNKSTTWFRQMFNKSPLSTESKQLKLFENILDTN
jgi:hypothetical protein